MAEEAFLLDTNICIYLLRGEPRQLGQRLIEQPGALFLSSISLAEVAVGYGDHVYASPDVAGLLRLAKIVSFDEEAAKVYGTLPFRRASLDRLIAAHALALGLTLVTNNEADFADVPGLRVENWTR